MILLVSLDILIGNKVYIIILLLCYNQSHKYEFLDNKQAQICNLTSLLGDIIDLQGFWSTGNFNLT